MFFCEISALSICFPVILTFFYYKETNRTTRIFYFFLYISACFDITSIIFSNLNINDLFLSHLDTLVQVLLLGMVYYCILKISNFRKPVIFLTICLSLFVVINAIVIQGIDHFNSYSRITGSAFLIILPLLYFYELFTRVTIISIEKDFMFWISIAIFVYFSGTLFLFILFQNNNFGLTKEINSQIWIVNSFLNILQNILFGIAILCRRKI